MPWRRWLWLLAAMMGVGLLQIGQRGSLVTRGYRLGEKFTALHEQRTALAWQQVRVDELRSPTRLGQVAQARQMELTAWSTLAEAPQVQVAARQEGSGP